MTAIDAINAANVSALDAAKALGLTIERNGRGKCPWHAGGNERRGALSFKNGKCHCFACGNGGDAIALAGQILGLDAKEAAEALCSTLGIAYTGNHGNDWQAKKREVMRERERAEAQKRSAIDEHTRLCAVVRECDAALAEWTPERMEREPDAFWEILNRKAAAEKKLEVITMYLNSDKD